MEKITVLLSEDHQVVREGLRSLLTNQPDIEVVGEAANGLEAVELSRKLRPQVVLMDISMPGSNGLEATRRIKRELPETRILVLSSYDELDCVDELINSGATGFLSKRSASNQLPDAIRAVRRDKQVFSPEITKRLQDRKLAASRVGRSIHDAFQLTVREQEVLQLIAEGLPNKGVADRLGISIKTVEKHRQAVMNKLNLHEVAGLTRYAIKQGLVSEKSAPPAQPQESEPNPADNPPVAH
jgi:DNA-binding NarL/FixJ family response regulator